MSENVEFENAVEEINDGVEQEIHSIEDVDTATDFELKHTPLIEIEELAVGQLVKVSIGLKGIGHPQTEEHLIEWIRVFVGSEPVGEEVFGATDTPVAAFEVERSNKPIVVQALCNLHGIWEARI